MSWRESLLGEDSLWYLILRDLKMSQMLFNQLQFKSNDECKKNLKGSMIILITLMSQKYHRVSSKVRLSLLLLQLHVLILRSQGNRRRALLLCHRLSMKV
jgi:hypothetical protein